MSDSQILEIVEVFADLDSEQLKKIYAVCTEKVCSLGTTIVKENTPSTEIFIILEGEVEVSVHEAAGLPHEKKISMMERGQSFGEVTLVDQGLRMATVRCKTEICRLLEISRSDLLHILQENPEIGYKVLYNLAADLCLKLRQATYRVY